MPNQINRNLKLSRLVVLACCIALIILYTLNNFVFNSVSTLSFWLLKTIPLGLFLPALLSGKLRAYQWLCFLIMIYFMQGILDIFTLNKVIQGSIDAFLTVLLFCSAIFFVHGSQKQIKINQG